MTTTAVLKRTLVGDMGNRFVFIAELPHKGERPDADKQPLTKRERDTLAKIANMLAQAMAATAMSMEAQIGLIGLTKSVNSLALSLGTYSARQNLGDQAKDIREHARDVQQQIKSVQATTSAAPNLQQILVSSLQQLNQLLPEVNKATGSRVVRIVTLRGDKTTIPALEAKGGLERKVSPVDAILKASNRTEVPSVVSLQDKKVTPALENSKKIAPPIAEGRNVQEAKAAPIVKTPDRAVIPSIVSVQDKLTLPFTANNADFVQAKVVHIPALENHSKVIGTLQAIQPQVAQDVVLKAAELFVSDNHHPEYSQKPALATGNNTPEVSNSSQIVPMSLKGGEAESKTADRKADATKVEDPMTAALKAEVSASIHPANSPTSADTTAYTAPKNSAISSASADAAAHTVGSNSPISSTTSGDAATYTAPNNSSTVSAADIGGTANTASNHSSMDSKIIADAAAKTMADNPTTTSTASGGNTTYTPPIPPSAAPEMGTGGIGDTAPSDQSRGETASEDASTHRRSNSASGAHMDAPITENCSHTESWDNKQENPADKFKEAWKEAAVGACGKQQCDCHARKSAADADFEKKQASAESITPQTTSWWGSVRDVFRFGNTEEAGKRENPIKNSWNKAASSSCGKSSCDCSRTKGFDPTPRPADFIIS